MPNTEYIDPASLAQMSEEQLLSFKQSFPTGTEFSVAQAPVNEAPEGSPDNLDPEAFNQLNPEQLADFATKTKWSPYTHAQANPSVLQDDLALTKLALTDLNLRKRGFKLSDVNWKGIPSSIWDIAKGTVAYAGKVATSTAAPLAETVSQAMGEPPGVMAKVGEVAAGEATAATELASTGFVDMLRRGLEKTGRAFKIEKPLEQYTDEDAKNLFRKELGIRNQLSEISRGKGEVTGALVSKDVELNPEEISKAAAGDPLTLMAFGKAFRVVNAVTGKVLATAVSENAALQTLAKLNTLRGTTRAAETLAKGIPSAENIAVANEAAIEYYSTRAAAGAVPRVLETAGRVVEAIPTPAEAVGKVAQVAGAGLEKAAPAAAVVTGAGGLLSGHPTALLTLLGGTGAKGVAGRIVGAAGEKLAAFGERMLSKETAGWTRAIEDAINLPVNVGKGAMEGLPVDLGLAALTADTPEETRESPLMMTAFGGIKGGLKSYRDFVRGQTIAPRPWTPSNSWSRSYGNFPDFDAAHRATMQIADEGVRQRVAGMRDFAETTGTELFQFKGPSDMAQALIKTGRFSPADAANFAEANAVALGEIPDAQGVKRRVIFVRDPAAAPHEVGHPFENILTQDQQDLLYAQAERQYGSQGLVQRAFREAQALAVTPEAQAEFKQDPLRYLLRATGFGKGVDISTPKAVVELAKRYAAKEIVADTFGTVVKHATPQMLQDTTFLGNVARIMARTMIMLGQDPYAGEIAQGPFATPVKFPLAEQVRGMAEPFGQEAGKAIVEPRVITPKAPATPQEGAQKAKDWVNQNPTGNADKDQAVTGLADALANRQGIRVLYWGAKGDPAGQVTSVRPERRAEIEAQRTAENKDRVLIEKEIFPYRVDVRKNGPQFVGWSPDNFDANVGKFAEWLGYVSRKGGDVSLVPYEFDKQTGRFTARGRADLLADAQKFMENQRAGFTGAGGELVVPAEVEARGFFTPEKTGEAPQPLEQNRADIVNYLFNIQIPETVTRVAPLHLAGQEISEATAAGRLVVPVRPRGEYAPEKLEAAGIPGPRSVLEVNPFRQWVEETAKANQVARPSLIEVSQRLNIPRIEKAVPSLRPEYFGGNVLTLAAGFQPSSNPRAVSMAAIRDRETGKVYEGSWHGEAMMKAIEDATRPTEGIPETPDRYEDGFTTNTPGEFLTREEALQRAVELRQLDERQYSDERRIVGAEPTYLESDAFRDMRQFQPREDEVRRIAEMTPEEFGRWAQNAVARGGYTQVAVDAGLGATSREFVDFLKASQLKSAEEFKRGMASGNLEGLMAVANRTQFFREAYEAATGTGSAGFALRQKDPNTKFPFPEPEAQAQPRGLSDEEFSKQYFVPRVDIERRYQKLKTEDDKLRALGGGIGGFEREQMIRYAKDLGHLAGVSGDFNEPAPVKMAAPKGLTPVEAPVYESAWLMPGGEAYEVKSEKGRFYHDDAIDAFSEFETGSGVDNVNKFQYDSGALRVSIMDSARNIDDNGGSVGISLSRRPTAEQLSYIRKMLSETRERGYGDDVREEPALTFVAIDVTAGDGSVLAAEGFAIHGKVDVAKVLRYLQEPLREVPQAQAQPRQTYKEASQDEGNPWIRPPGITSNADRLLMVQFSSDLINKNAVKDQASAYYDKLYAGTREGYARLQDFWEIPQWTGFLSKFAPNADLYVVRDMAQAKQFLDTAGYGRVAFSALDVNAKLIKELASSYKGTFDVGGYAAPSEFKGVPNIKWHDSMESLAKDMGVPYVQGVDYRHFAGSDVIPRLTMSQGCKHKCAFCTVEKTLKETPQEVIEQQADEIGKLGSKLVYLNDKTFGQAPNYKTLPDIYERIKAVNPDFKGFIIQTTASQMKSFTPEFLTKAGIKFVELGIETYNDPILKAMHKPATESLMDRAVASLREAKVALIPNILIGLPGETAETYARTLDFLKRNKDIISHANIYNLAVYKEAELGKKLTTASDDDFNENVLEKSWMTNPEVHRTFAGDLYGMADELLGTKPASAAFQPKLSEEPEAVKGPAARSPKTDKIYAGVTHYDALEKMRSREGEGSMLDAEMGFVTNGGEFLDRTDAYYRAREYDQLPDDYVFRPDRILESVTFDRQRQAQPSKREEAIPGYAVGTSEHWIDRAGRAIPAPEGHSAEAYSILPANWKPENPEDPMASIYPAMYDRGYLRVVEEEKAVYVDGGPRNFSGLPRAQRNAIIDLAFGRNKRIAYNGIPVEGGPEVQAQPAEKIEDMTELWTPRIVPPEGEEQKPVLYVVRHGSTEFNNEIDPTKDRIRGHLNVPLDAKGIEEAQQTAQDLAGSNIVRLYTSNLDRAIDTAKEISKTTGAEVIQDARLRPWNLGPEIEGHLTSEVLPKIDYFFKHPDEAPKGGETFNVFKTRFLTAYRQIQKDNPDDNAGIVTHYRNLRVLEAWQKAGAEGNKIDTADILEDRKEPPAGYQIVGKDNQMVQAAEKPAILAGQEVQAQPGDKFPKGEPGAAFKKVWITPDGKNIQLGGMWHADWLDQNRNIAKKYGMTDAEIGRFTGTESADTRENALRHGFARVNYDINSGKMTVEARAADWNKLRDAYARLVEKNLDDIDTLRTVLFNRKVNDIVDSQEVQLFRIREAKDKIAAIPFLEEAPRQAGAPQVPEAAGATTGIFPGQEEKARAIRFANIAKGIPTETQAQPRFSAKEFEDELKKVREGLSGGQTFNPDGSVWTGTGDIVSLASVNVRQGELTPERVIAALGPFADLLDEPGVTAGVFSFSQGGKPMVSIDLNLVVPQKYRANTLAFAKANDQVAIWDAAKGEEVRSGGKGNTKLKSLGEILDAIPNLSKGKPVDVEEIIRQNRETEPAAETGELFGTKRVLSSYELGNMTKADLARHYPEAVIPGRRDESIPSAITESPLYKAAANEAEAVKAFARRLVEFAKEYQDRPEFKSGSKWYSEIVPQLKKRFGKDTKLMAELLAATSPQNAPESNYAYALDALEGFKSGRFDKMVAKYEEGLAKLNDETWKDWFQKQVDAGKVPEPPAEPTPAAFLEHWNFTHGLEPKQSNGKKFGISSPAVLQVLARRWLEKTGGLKTQNFVKNLLGIGHEATIDLWADRTMRRIGYSGFKARWRILPKNATGVSDTDFLFSQKVFRAAADELGMKPDALQGALWFAEKSLWNDEGWSRLDLGDFRKEIPKTEMLRAGIKERLKRAEAGATLEEQQLPLVEPRNLNE